MARFSAILLAYFLIGAVMWGGGAIAWDESGVGGLIITDATESDIEVNENTSQQLERSGGPIQEAAQSMGGPILAIWNFVVRFVGYLFWPVTVLQSVNAPTRIVVTLGGSFSVIFLGAVVRLIRRSA